MGRSEAIFNSVCKMQMFQYIMRDRCGEKYAQAFAPCSYPILSKLNENACKDTQKMQRTQILIQLRKKRLYFKFVKIRFRLRQRAIKSVLSVCQ
jgi:hypothetical protein